MAQATELKHMQLFRYESPELDRPKVSMSLSRIGSLGFGIQKAIKDGGETNMHSHTAADSHWFVLQGKAEFYGYGDVVVGTLGKYEGISIPHGVPYWFKSVGDEELEIVHVTASVPDVKSERVNYTPVVEYNAGRLGGRDATDEERAIAAQGVAETLKQGFYQPNAR